MIVAPFFPRMSAAGVMAVPAAGGGILSAGSQQQTKGGKARDTADQQGRSREQQSGLVGVIGARTMIVVRVLAPVRMFRRRGDRWISPAGIALRSSVEAVSRSGRSSGGCGGFSGGRIGGRRLRPATGGCQGERGDGGNLEFHGLSPGQGQRRCIRRQSRTGSHLAIREHPSRPLIG